MEKLLEDASIKISAVASSVATVSPRAMLGALVAGERDSKVMADLARGKMRGKIPDLSEALIGRFDDHHVLLVGQMLTRLDLVDQALKALDAQIELAMAPWTRQYELLQTIPGIGRPRRCSSLRPGWTCPSSPRPSTWQPGAGVTPAMNESAGVRRPAGTRRGNKWLCSTLVEAASSVSRTKSTYLGSQYARIASRRGAKRAAVAHSRVVSGYWMLTRDEHYQDLGPDWLSRRNDQAHVRRPVGQLERLGHTVVLDRAA